jgi:hypothetical protein
MRNQGPKLKVTSWARAIVAADCTDESKSNRRNSSHSSFPFAIVTLPVYHQPAGGESADLLEGDA